MKKTYRSLFFINLILLFLSGTIYTIEVWRVLQPFMLVGSVISILLYSFILKIDSFKFDSKQMLLYILFVFFSLTSSFINFDIELIGGSILLLFIYISLIIALPEIVRKRRIDYTKLIIKSIWIGQMPIIVLSLLLWKIELRSYSGMFYNPNSFGNFISTIFIIPYSGVVYYLEMLMERKRINKINFITNILLSLFMLVLTTISSSRTSFVSILLIVLLSIILLFRNLINNGKIRIKYSIKLFQLLSIIMIVGVLMAFFSPMGNILYDGIISKFERKASNIFAGRLYIWTTTIKEMKLLGHGRDYFSKFGLAGHNTFISILGQYGFLPIIFLFLFLINSFKKAKIYLRNMVNDKYKYLPIFSISIFIALSMGEGMMLKTSMLLMFACIGLTEIDVWYD